MLSYALFSCLNLAFTCLLAAPLLLSPPETCNLTRDLLYLCYGWAMRFRTLLVRSALTSLSAAVTHAAAHVN